MSQVAQVKVAVDIVEIIGERVSLSRSGTNWRGLCPFHSEKSPSFFVNEQLQRYKCFGCAESGDVLTFLEKYDGLSFGEALQTLADRAGITLTEFHRTQADDERDQLLTVLDLAKEYYHYVLTQHQAGEAARKYLKERGTTQESIRLFQLGYALPAWDGLTTYLTKKKKFSLELLVKSGLVIRAQGGRHYDRFRDRVMFPLTNHRGQTVGFSGRVLDASAKEAKYINTPETLLYHKAELLFGFHELGQFIRKEKEVVVVEGEFDVISSAQAHVNNVVAIKGSAFTPQHARVLKRSVERVILSLDSDAAGVEATKRAIPIAREVGLELRVLTLPPELAAKDPDDLARTQPKVWREAVKQSISVYEFLLRVALKQYNPTTPEGKRKIVTELAPVLGNIPHAVEKDFYLKELAKALAVEEKLVRQDIDRLSKSTGSVAPTILASLQPKKNVEKPNRQYKIEEYVWFLLLRQVPEELSNSLTKLSGIRWSQPTLQLLFEQLTAFKGKFHLDRFSQSLPEDLQAQLFDLYLNPEYSATLETMDLSKEWQQALKEMQKLSVKQEVMAIAQQLDELDGKAEKTAADEALQDELLKKIVGLKKQMTV